MGNDCIKKSSTSIQELNKKTLKKQNKQKHQSALEMSSATAPSSPFSRAFVITTIDDENFSTTTSSSSSSSLSLCAVLPSKKAESIEERRRKVPNPGDDLDNISSISAYEEKIVEAKTTAKRANGSSESTESGDDDDDESTNAKEKKKKLSAIVVGPQAAMKSVQSILGQEFAAIVKRRAKFRDSTFFNGTIDFLVSADDDLSPLCVALKARLGAKSVDELRRLIAWKTIQELTSSDSTVAVSKEAINVLNLTQDWLGFNCSHYGVLWTLAKQQSSEEVNALLSFIAPNDNSSEVYHFRLWKLGFWYDVVVDSLLPVSTLNQQQRPLFSFDVSTSKNTFLFSLLEKALAKICGRYEYVQNSSFEDVCLYFSGGIFDEYSTQVCNLLTTSVDYGSYFGAKSSLSAYALGLVERAKAFGNSLRATHPNVDELCEIMRAALEEKRDAAVVACIADNYELARKFGIVCEEMFFATEISTDENSWSKKWITVLDPRSRGEARMQKFELGAFLERFKYVKVFNLKPESKKTVPNKSNSMNLKTCLLTKWRVQTLLGSLPSTERNIEYDSEFYKKYTIENKCKTSKNVLVSFVRDYQKSLFSDPFVLVFIYIYKDKQWSFQNVGRSTDAQHWCFRLTVLANSKYLVFFKLASATVELACDLKYCLRLMTNEDNDENGRIVLKEFDQKPKFTL